MRKILVLIIITSLILYSCGEPVKKSDNLPYTGLETLQLPITVNELSNKYKINYEQYVGFQFKPKDTTFFDICYLGIDGEVYESVNMDSEGLNIDRFIFYSEKPGLVGFSKLLDTLNIIYGAAKRARVKSNSVPYWIMPSENLLFLYLDSNSCKMIYSTRGVGEAEEYINSHYRGW